MGRKRTLGFTLIEVVVTLVLLVIMMAVTLKGFGGGPDRVSTLALATAIADELRASRELAVSNGHPVAIGIPTEGGRGRHLHLPASGVEQTASHLVSRIRRRLS